MRSVLRSGGMMRALLALAISGQMVSGLEPNFAMLARPDVQKKLGLSSDSVAKIKQVSQETSKAAAGVKNEEERDAKANKLLAQSLKKIPLDSKQIGLLISATVGEYGPRLLEMPGVAGYLKLGKEKVQKIQTEFVQVNSVFDLKRAQVLKSLRTSPTKNIKSAPELLFVENQRDSELWRTLLKNFNGPQVIRTITLLKRDPWENLTAIKQNRGSLG